MNGSRIARLSTTNPPSSASSLSRSAHAQLTGNVQQQPEVTQGAGGQLTRSAHAQLVGGGCQSGDGTSVTSLPRPSTLTNHRAHLSFPPVAETELRIGERVTVSGVKTGVLKYVGPTEFAVGTWCGIELDEPVGKNSGEKDGVQYFECRPMHGIFAPLSKVTLVGSSSGLPELGRLTFGGVRNKDAHESPTAVVAPTTRATAAAAFSKLPTLSGCITNSNSSSVAASSTEGITGPKGRLGTTTSKRLQMPKSSPGPILCETLSDDDEEANFTSTVDRDIDPGDVERLKACFSSGLLQMSLQQTGDADDQPSQQVYTGEDSLSPIIEGKDEDCGNLDSPLDLTAKKRMSNVPIDLTMRQRQNTEVVDCDADYLNDLDDDPSSLGLLETLQDFTLESPDAGLADDLLVDAAMAASFSTDDVADLPLDKPPGRISISENVLSLLLHSLKENHQGGDDADTGNESSGGGQGTSKTNSARPLSADTGCQCDSDSITLSSPSVAGVGCSGMENPVMRWSTCSQDSGAVSDLTRNATSSGLHSVDSCINNSSPPCVSGTQSPRTAMSTSCATTTTTTTTASQNLVTTAENVMQTSSEPEADLTPERETRSEVDAGHEARPPEGDAEPEVSECDDVTTSASVDISSVAGSNDVSASSNAGTTKDFKKPKAVCPPIKHVESKVKAMISSKPANPSVENAKRSMVRKSKWDEVSSRIAASLEKEQKIVKKEIRSRINSNLQGAKESVLIERQRHLGAGSVTPRAASRCSQRTDMGPNGDCEGFDAENENIPPSRCSRRGSDVSSVMIRAPVVIRSEPIKPVVPKREYQRPWAEKVPKPESVPKAPRGPINKPLPVKKGGGQSVLKTQLQLDTERKSTKLRQPAANHVNNSTHSNDVSKATPESILPPTVVEFTKEVHRLGALCEARTKELNMCKMDLRRATMGFSAMSLVVKHIAEKIDTYNIPELTQELHTAKSAIEKANIEIEQSKQILRDELARHEEEIKQLRVSNEKSLQELQEEHRRQVEKLQDSHDERVAQLKAQFAKLSAEDTERYENGIGTLKELHRQRILELNEEYELQLDNQQAQHELREKELQERYAEKCQEYETLREEATKFQEKVLQSTDSRIAWLSEKNERLQKEVHSLNAVLEMKREELRCLNHVQLENQRCKEQIDLLRDKAEKLEAKNEDLQALIGKKVEVQDKLVRDNVRLLELSEKQNRILSKVEKDKEMLMYKLREKDASVNGGSDLTRVRSSSGRRTYSASSHDSNPVMARSWHIDMDDDNVDVRCNLEHRFGEAEDIDSTPSPESLVTSSDSASGGAENTLHHTTDDKVLLA